jgi:hypothetical protein
MRLSLLLASCLLTASTMDTVEAGPCTTEIDKLTKVLQSRDLGAGPWVVSLPFKPPTPLLA